MRRRDFFILSAAVAWPFAALCQAQRRVVGILGSGSAQPPAYLAAFIQALKVAGFIEGQNINIEIRQAEGHYERLPSLASELLGRSATVIVGLDAPAALAAKAATKTIPIVFITGAGAVTLGLVDNLSRPGGNLTGVSILMTVLGPKYLELLRELLPGVGTILVLESELASWCT